MGNEGIVDGEDASHAGGSFVVNSHFVVLSNNANTEFLGIVRKPRMKSR